VNRKVTVPEGRSERTAVMMRQSKGFGQRGRDVPAASYQRFITQAVLVADNPAPLPHHVAQAALERTGKLGARFESTRPARRAPL